MSNTSPDQMSFWEHLQELRVRLVRSLLIVAAAFALTYGFRFKLMLWAQKPFFDTYKKHAIAQAVADHLPIPTAFEPFAYTSLTEPFFSLMRLAVWAAIFIAAPFLFAQVWGFIKPGLYARERRFAIPFVLATSACFLGGAAFAYFNAFQFLGDILFEEALKAGLRTNLHLEDYLDLFIYTVVGTGLMFELPVLVFFLARFRIVTARWLLKYWRHATIAIFIISAFLTPGDVIVTTIFFGVVLEGLYFISVLVAWAAQPRKPKATDVLEDE
ncbi:twin-arginine translocase subunit TatC [Mesoterricola sediminis]|uniref:Sec-independent protein translocase protein TatC n=1 Tax=Mesoterricola sediminis TaxID=2927980 RepID=A0AA48H371_9BACT|nr:twin-arginine translocase subunit TatC [Mesoterricola sediminis]BDU76636.1 Sec-independent protein translocase protein TatC [Mesoterricola sediminis]